MTFLLLAAGELPGVAPWPPLGHHLPILIVLSVLSDLNNIWSILSVLCQILVSTLSVLCKFSASLAIIVSVPDQFCQLSVSSGRILLVLQSHVSCVSSLPVLSAPPLSPNVYVCTWRRLSQLYGQSFMARPSICTEIQCGWDICAGTGAGQWLSEWWDWQWNTGAGTGLGTDEMGRI